MAEGEQGGVLVLSSERQEMGGQHGKGVTGSRPRKAPPDVPLLQARGFRATCLLREATFLRSFPWQSLTLSFVHQDWGDC